MKILDSDFSVVDVFDNSLTIPDCFVVRSNKLGRGNGEAKFYIASKVKMRNFFSSTGTAGFEANCFILKRDLILYLNAIRQEYLNPTFGYSGVSDFPRLWQERMNCVESLEERIDFVVKDQVQIKGDRGYVNSKDLAYQLIRKLSLPLVSYVSFMHLQDKDGRDFYYWRLFVDFDAISDKEAAQVFTYGKKESRSTKSKGKKSFDEVRKARVGQGKYRELLLEECPFCPITMINDERLLIASHIKPWACATGGEKIDPQNGFILSPLYDRLFDRGFITFTDDKRVKISNWLSPQNKKRIGIKENQLFQMLPINNKKRKEYLKFHRDCVFKG